MKSEIDIEINRILEEVYKNPIKDINVVKRAIIETEYRHIEYLESIGLIKRIKSADGGGKFGIQLENKGYEVFEKYRDWFNYKIKIIDRKSKIEKAKDYATQYWWIPILISSASLIISLFAYFKK